MLDIQLKSNNFPLNTGTPPGHFMLIMTFYGYIIKSGSAKIQGKLIVKKKQTSSTQNMLDIRVEIIDKQFPTEYRDSPLAYYGNNDILR